MTYSPARDLFVGAAYSTSDDGPSRTSTIPTNVAVTATVATNIAIISRRDAQRPLPPM